MSKKNIGSSLDEFLREEGIKEDVDLLALHKAIGDEIRRRGMGPKLESLTEGQEKAWEHAAEWAQHADNALATAFRAVQESEAGDYALISIAASLREMCALQRAK